MGGDFNIILHQSEKSGGQGWHRSGALEFYVCLAATRLTDLGFPGPIYTWWNKREGTSTIHQRIDRLLGNSEWLGLFRSSSVLHLNRTCSDHSPLLLNYSMLNRTHLSAFRFLNVWATHPTFLDIVKASWDTPVYGWPLSVFSRKLRNIKAALKNLE